MRSGAAPPVYTGPGAMAFTRQALEVGWIAEVGADEARLAARGGNCVDSLGASGGVAAMDDDLGAVAGQLQSYCTADPGRRARHERLLTLEVTRLGRGHCCSPKVVVHKPLGAHNSAVSVMVPDQASVDPSRANALTLRLNRVVFLLDPLGEVGGVRLCSILPDEMPPIEERVTAMGQEVRHRCRNIKPEDQPSVVRDSQQNSQHTTP